MRTAFILLAFSYIVPIIGQPWISAQNEVLAFAGVVLLVFHAAKVNRTRVIINSPLCILLLMQGALFIQFITGRVHYTGDFVNWMLYLLTSCLCILAGQTFTVKGETTEYSLSIKLAIVFVCVSLISVIIAIAQSLNLYLDSEWIVRTVGSRAGSNLGQPNHFATLCSIGLVSLMYLAERFNFKKLTTYLGALFLLFGLVLSASRTGVLEVILISVGGYLFYRKIRQDYLINPIFVIGGYWVIRLAWQLWSAQTSEVIDYVSIVQLETSPGSRTCVWKSLIDSGVTRFWSGWGLGQIYEAQQNAISLNPCGDSYTYAHNIVIELFVGLGVLGLLLSIGFIAWFFKVSRNAKTIEEGYCVGVIGVVVVHSQLEFPYAYAYLLFPIMLLIGRVTYIQESSSSKVLSIPRATVMMLLLTIVLIGSIWCVDYFRSQEEFRRVRFEMLKIGQIDRGYRSPRVYLLTQLSEAMEAIRVVPSQKITAEQLRLLERTSARFPWPVLSSRYATALALNDDVNAAVRQLNIIHSVYGDRIFLGLLQRWREAESDDLAKLNAVLEKLNE
jgi:O-antigen ligase